MSRALRVAWLGTDQLPGGGKCPAVADLCVKSWEGTAAMAASHLYPASKVLGANDRVRIGLIGGGGRGQEILKAALRCPEH